MGFRSDVLVDAPSSEGNLAGSTGSTLGARSTQYLPWGRIFETLRADPVAQGEFMSRSSISVLTHRQGVCALE